MISINESKHQSMDDDPRKAILQRILDSETFQDKELYRNLLSYLVDSSLNDVAPKEVTVARDVFHKSADFNTAEDATVRVHMHNLRNKLKQYYQTEGSGDDLKLFIPKGHYRVEFVKNEAVIPSPNRRFMKIFAAAAGALLMLLVGYIGGSRINGFMPRDAETGKADALWRHFFSNDLPTTVVIGDFLVFHEYSQTLDRPRRIQDYEINTVDELNGYIKAHPENYPESWSLGELPHNAIYNIIDIMPIFESFQQKIEIAFTTEIDIHFIKSKNILYIGEFKNLRVLHDLAAALPIRFETLPWWHGTLTFQVNDSMVTLSTMRNWEVNRYVTDLGIIAELPGQAGENYIIVAGFGYNAQIKLVEMLTQKASWELLQKQIMRDHESFPPFFIMAVEVNGFDRASTTAEIKYFAPIDKADYLQSLIPIN